MDLTKPERVIDRDYTAKRKRREQRAAQGNLKAMKPSRIREAIESYKSRASEPATVSESVIEEAKRLSEEKGIPFTLHPNMCKILHKNFQHRRTYKNFQ